MTAQVEPRESRPNDPADLSSRAFWSSAAAEREEIPTRRR